MGVTVGDAIETAFSPVLVPLGYVLAERSADAASHIASVALDHVTLASPMSASFLGPSSDPVSNRSDQSGDATLETTLSGHRLAFLPFDVAYVGIGRRCHPAGTGRYHARRPVPSRARLRRSPFLGPIECALL